MNVENILKVADAIEKASIPGLGFNMNQMLDEAVERNPDHTGRNCGTVGCIAGWAYVLATGSVRPAGYGAEEPSVRPAGYGAEEPAREYLGLGPDVAFDLFYPDVADYSTIPPETAVAVLRHLAETGEVDWDRALSLSEAA